MYKYIYIYNHIHTCVYIYIYLYMYICMYLHARANRVDRRASGGRQATGRRASRHPPCRFSLSESKIKTFKCMVRNKQRVTSLMLQTSPFKRYVLVRCTGTSPFPIHIACTECICGFAVCLFMLVSGWSHFLLATLLCVCFL